MTKKAVEKYILGILETIKNNEAFWCKEESEIVLLILLERIFSTTAYDVNLALDRIYRGEYRLSNNTGRVYFFDNPQILQHCHIGLIEQIKKLYYLLTDNDLNQPVIAKVYEELHNQFKEISLEVILNDIKETVNFYCSELRLKYNETDRAIIEKKLDHRACNSGWRLLVESILPGEIYLIPYQLRDFVDFGEWVDVDPIIQKHVIEHTSRYLSCGRAYKKKHQELSKTLIEDEYQYLTEHSLKRDFICVTP